MKKWLIYLCIGLLADLYIRYTQVNPYPLIEHLIIMITWPIWGTVMVISHVGGMAFDLLRIKL